MKRQDTIQWHNGSISSYLKRKAGEADWSELVPEMAMIITGEIDTMIRQRDQVQGVWDDQSTQVGKLWCDASSLAMGVCLEIGANIVEDSRYFRC
jgi:hypothetical protein